MESQKLLLENLQNFMQQFLVYSIDLFNIVAHVRDLGLPFIGAVCENTMKYTKVYSKFQILLLLKK